MKFNVNRKALKFARLAGFAAVGSMAVMSTGVIATDYEAQINRLLNGTRDYAREHGYSSTHNRYHGRLDEGEYKTVTLELDRGTEYMIVAQCDTDCSDMDLWLYDDNGNEIDKDVLDDDTPIVRVTPRWTARFELKTRMYDCTAEPCFYGIGVYGR